MSSRDAFEGYEGTAGGGAHGEQVDFVDLETWRHLTIVASDDTREAFRAFLEKREPRFSGR